MPAPVAVAVVSWNTRVLLDACLGSLRADHEAGRAEVWVVDNASSDGSADLVRDEHPWVHLIACAENLGFGAAVNLVGARTETEWVAPANADIELAPGALAELLAAGARFPLAGAVAPALRMPDGRVQHSAHPFPTLPRTLAFNLALPGVGDRLTLPGKWDMMRSRNVDWVHGAFLLVRRAAWDQIGGFDAEQWMYAEDLDLGWRLRQAGWRTRYEPAAMVHHHAAAATRQAWGEATQARAQAAAYAWMTRRRGAVRTRAFAAINVAGALARAMVPARRAEMLRYARMHAGGLTRPEPPTPRSVRRPGASP